MDDNPAQTDKEGAMKYDVLDRGTDEEMTVAGYIRCMWKTVITWIFIVLTVGVLRLVFYWKPYWFLRCTHRVISLNQATHLHLQDQYQQDFVVEVKHVHQLQSPDTGGVTNEGFSEEKPHTSQSTTIVQIESNGISQTTYKYFNCKKVKYILPEHRYHFERLCGLEDGKLLNYFHRTPSLTTFEATKRATLYGLNKLEVHVTPVRKIIAREVISPFYVFQLFSVCLWLADSYEYYASVILVLSIASMTVTTMTTRQMERALKSTVPQVSLVKVKRNGEFKDISSTELVPGDIIEIPRSGVIMDCDAVLLTGNCIVNESMLTGESMPLTKTPLPNPEASKEMYDPKGHQNHTLYCGTRVIKSMSCGIHPVTAMVIRTGFMTAKGGLIRSIMFPKPVNFKFYRETCYFVGALAFLALVGLIYLAATWSHRHLERVYIIKRVLDLITIAVPPLLPAALAVGTMVGQTRLKISHRIYCVQPSCINIAGSINAVCFDKTGTLTEDDLDIHSVITVVDERLSDTHVTDVSTLPSHSLVKIAMATCHSLTEIDGQLSGDTLDLKMFDSTEWNYEEFSADQHQYNVRIQSIVKELDGPDIGIIRGFTFSSSLKRMSVITKNLSSAGFDLFAKGSPEVISCLCKPESLPMNLADVLAENTQNGFRVIGLAHRKLDLSYEKLQLVERSDMEANMTFIGLVIMENRIKPETTPVIVELHEANIKTIMVTGDNLLTALSVAQRCKLIPNGCKVILVSQNELKGKRFLEFHTENAGPSSNGTASGTCALDIDEQRNTNYCFAMTGKTWEYIRRHRPALIGKIVVQGCVYARMSPEQKVQLVEELQSIGYRVAMCGDGTNDCGALKVAHCGISLSETGASIASPFTSKNANISCVPHLLKEGRCTLVASFGIFKFICGYSICQYISAIILRTLRNDLSQFEYLVIDLLYITSISITFPLTSPADVLHKTSPPVCLLDILPILSIVFSAFVFGGTQVGSMYIAKTNWTNTFPDLNMSWYYECPELCNSTVVNHECDKENTTKAYACPDNVFVIMLSFYQYIALAVMFAKGYPYRKHMFKNYFFLCNVVVLIIFTTWITIHPTKPIAEWLGLDENIPYEFKVGIVGLGIMTMFFCILFEELITGNTKVHAVLELLKNREKNFIKREPRRVQNLKNGFAEYISRELRQNL